jgi:hypothetical protein
MKTAARSRSSSLGIDFNKSIAVSKSRAMVAFDVVKYSFLIAASGSLMPAHQSCAGAASV